MKAIDVLNLSGTKVEEYSLNKNVFGIEPNQNVVYDAIQVSYCLRLLHLDL